MGSYGVPLTCLTERDAPDGGTMLTGRLGDAIVIGLAIEPTGNGARRWKLTLLEPNRRGRPRPPASVREAERQQLADRAGQRRRTADNR